jgi:hypothetical protein
MPVLDILAKIGDNTARSPVIVLGSFANLTVRNHEPPYPEFARLHGGRQCRCSANPECQPPERAKLCCLVRLYELLFGRHINGRAGRRTAGTHSIDGRHLANSMVGVVRWFLRSNIHCHFYPCSEAARRGDARSATNRWANVCVDSNRSLRVAGFAAKAHRLWSLGRGRASHWRRGSHSPLTSPSGQTEKNSVGANVFRVTLESGLRSMQEACLKRANTQN